MEPGIVYAPYIPVFTTDLSNAESTFEYDICVQSLMFREAMQDYEALKLPELLDSAIFALTQEIKLRQNKIRKKYCS